MAGRGSFIGDLGAFFTGLLPNSFKTFFLSMGVGVASGAIALTVVNYYIGKIQQQAGLLGDMAGIAHLGGLDKAISIVIGAVIIRATILASQAVLTKAS